MIKHTCAHCGKTFLTHPSVVAAGRRYCSVPCARRGGGGRPPVTRRCNYCGREYTRQAKYVGKFCSSRCYGLAKTQPLPERFWGYVDKRGPNECWPWTGYKDRKGYGRIMICQPGERGRPSIATHVSWLLHNGPIPDGLCALHNCPDGDNPACVNPAHLFLGTIAENNADKARKGRAVSGDAHYARREPLRVARGEGVGSAKLTAEAVRTIRGWVPESGQSRADLAAEFGVTKTTINRVLAGKGWRHVL